MLRDMASLKFFRRNGGNGPESDASENISVNAIDLSDSPVVKEPNRPPLSTIQNPGSFPEQEISKKRKLERTPSRNKGMLPPRTPEKLGTVRNRFGWGQRMEADLIENREDIKGDSSSAGTTSSLPPIQRGPSCAYTTPKSNRGAGKASSLNSENSLNQSTPTKSVSKPRSVNLGSLSRGVSVAYGPVSVVDTVEVPHFELREDSSFWMDHNVQVLVRVRPLNNMEKSSQGYNRCLRQESAQSITWICQPETRFTFDHVACETTTQEMLFGVAGLPMVENCISGYNSCIFAYGQTGSGKTYTMLGQIDDIEEKPSPEQGMMPRIFEFLFARIRAEEESRRDENIRYNCKCSFLEIYNEQITDLLDPSSTNLMLREDARKGIYVENLTEYEVNSVADVLKLLIQGSSNRKVAATNMNRESSRSHSVFTCVIESCWEKNSTTNFRYGRLNLVDLAGSERQKTSGAEGDRLKEAANINKSLSSLGHVIMVLVDVAHGKQRHIPYRDSRLTFLLQDSLGGNSKTMIIANVSPSMCCSSETLSTLKFAQRAKLIQNNAVVNEDTSGDVTALQYQIRTLKEEIALLRRQNVTRSLSFHPNGSRDGDGVGNIAAGFDGTSKVENENSCVEGLAVSGSPRIATKKLKSLEATLVGSLRREQIQESVSKKLEAEIEQLNRLVRQREEDNRGMKMMLRFREDKIQRMKSFVDGLIPPESYLLQERNALAEELELLRNRVDRNPEVTRFAMENIRLLEQLRSFQEFCQEGEREILLGEVSTLRDQLISLYDGSLKLDNIQAVRRPPRVGSGVADEHCENEPLPLEVTTSLKELEDCRNSLRSCLEENEKLTREIDDLHVRLNAVKSLCHDQEAMLEMLRENSDKGGQKRYSQTDENNGEIQVHLQSTDDHMPLCKFISNPRKDAELMDDIVLKYSDDVINLQLEMNSMKLMLEEERSSRLAAQKMLSDLSNDLDKESSPCLLTDDKLRDLENELKDAKSIIEALESQHILLLKDLEDMKVQNDQYTSLLGKKEEISCLKVQVASYKGNIQTSVSQVLGEPELRNHREDDKSHFRKQLKRMQQSLEEARRLNASFQSCHAFESSHEQEMDKVREQVEAETAEAIICLQEELAMVQQQFEIITAKDIETNKKLTLLEVDSRKLQDEVSLLEKENGELVEVIRRKDAETNKKLALLELESSELLNKVSLLGKENNKLVEVTQRKDEEMKSLTEEWEQLAYEIAKVLVDGNDALENASYEVDTIAQSYHKSWISEHVEKMINCILEKDALLEDLKKRLRDAQAVGHDAVWKLHSLKGATVAMNEAQQEELDAKDQIIYFLKSQLDEKELIITDLGNRFMERSASLEFAIEELEIDVEIAWERAFISDAVTCLLLGAKEEVAISGHPSREEDLTTSENLLVALGNELSVWNSCLKDCLECVGDASKRHWCGSRPDISEYKLSQENYFATFVDNQEVQLGSVRIDVEYDTQMFLVLREEVLSLVRELHVHLSRLLYENEEMKKNEEQNRVNLESLSAQVLKLQADINQRQNYYELTLLEMCHRLDSMMMAFQEAKSCCLEHKKVLSEELEFAKEVAAQKTIEAAKIVEKFDEAQSTMKEADIMVNALVKASELSKIEAEKRKNLESKLTLQRDSLIIENESLKTSANLMKQDLDVLLEEFLLNINESNSTLLALQELFTATKMTVLEDLELIVYDVRCLKSLIMESAALSKKCLEDIWTEIIAKDCAVSVLHLCHMGIFLEAITGLNAEISFLHHGLSESNSIITNLRDNNLRAKGELEAFSILRGKLLNDIKSSFNRIARKEQETSGFGERLSAFEKKILELQAQEDMLLTRSNSMSSEFGLLMKEIDDKNKAAVHNEESLLREQEVFCCKLEESFKVQENIQNRHGLLKELVFKHLDVLVDTSPFKSTSGMDNNHLSCIEGDEVIEHLQDLMEQYSENLLMTLSSKELELLVFASELNQKNVANLVVCCELEEQREEKKRMSRQLEKYECKVSELEKELEVATILANTEGNMLHKVFRESAIPKTEPISANLCHWKLRRQNIESSLLSGLQKRADRTIELEKEINRLTIMLERLKEEMIFLKVEHDLEKQLLVDMDLEMEMTVCAHSIISDELEIKSKEMSIQMEKIYELTIENELLKSKLIEVNNAKEELTSELMNLTVQHSIVTADLEIKDELIILLEQKCLTGQSLSIIERENSNLLHMLQRKDILLNSTRSKANHCLVLIKKIDTAGSRMYQSIDKLLSMSFSEVTTERMNSFLDDLSKGISEFEMASSKTLMEYECIIVSAEELFSENLMLRGEMVRKDEVLSGLSFDLSILQESASMAKDQEDELREMKATLEALEKELAMKSDEVDNCSAQNQILEASLKEKITQISVLELENSNITRSFHEFSNENHEMKKRMNYLYAQKNYIEDELEKKSTENEELAKQAVEMQSLLESLNILLKGMRSDLDKAAEEKDHLHNEVNALKEKLAMTQALAEENEALATEAREIAEKRKAYAEDKEEEVKLLERSIEELECTIGVLENKVEIVKDEAEKQCLQSEELEEELQNLRHQMLKLQSDGLNTKICSTTNDSNDDLQRCVHGQVSVLQDSEEQMEVLGKLVRSKDFEIEQLKIHISELILHAEAQANEYKQKFKALEAMAQEVKPEPASSHAMTVGQNKSEKGPAKSRGSGSPFKCIGLGLAHQLNSEKDEELSAVRLRMEELEALAASRQKEIFMLNTRLAVAESMTHDVIRDLLGVKLDMTNYASLLDQQKVKDITEKARQHNELSQEKDQEILKLRQQLNEFIDERTGWLEDINRRHAEIVAAQIACEKLRQRDQLLSVENDMLKMENANQKKRVLELEEEVKKLSGQQNLKQRIHHHAKIKEESNLLKAQNEELAAKLRHTETLLVRVSDELARYRASSGKKPYINVDEEQTLKNKLKETEEERIQLAQRLLSICTNILKAAGITCPARNISPSAAEEALVQLKDQITSTERELQDLKFKNKIREEQARLTELRLQNSPSNLKRRDSCCTTPQRISCSPSMPAIK